MKNESPNQPAAAGADATADRRWLIGICITLVFGVFGVVMALLSYGEHTRTTASADAPGVAAPPAAPQPAAAPAAPAETTAPTAEIPSKGKGKGRGMDQ